jgi:hypothetical protein
VSAYVGSSKNLKDLKDFLFLGDKDALFFQEGQESLVVALPRRARSVEKFRVAQLR